MDLHAPLAVSFTLHANDLLFGPIPDIGTLRTLHGLLCAVCHRGPWRLAPVCGAAAAPLVACSDLIGSRVTQFRDRYFSVAERSDARPKRLLGRGFAQERPLV
jgi:hypothetical protein